MQKIQKEKEDEPMSEKTKAIHKAFCNYEVSKAMQPLRIYSIREPQRKPSGIRTSGLSKAMLAQTLASLF